MEDGTSIPRGPRWREYIGRCKLDVVGLAVFTAMVGMLMAVPGFLAVDTLLLGASGIGLAAASGAVFTDVADRRVDSAMARTGWRPGPAGEVEPVAAILLGIALGAGSVAILLFVANWLTAALTVVSLVAYTVVYTVYLKWATPLNIVVGGAAGAMPPVLGWVAVTDRIAPHALLLFLIMFAWRPPRFWALALHRREEHAQAEGPMLPATHGEKFTRLQILLYSIILFVASLLPFATRMSGRVYLAGAVALGGWFLVLAVGLVVRASRDLPVRMFRYSTVYLIGLFLLLLADHYLRG